MDPFIGQIKCFGFDYAPMDHMLCNGNVYPVPQFTALFSLLGTRFGGNGSTNFGVPNLQGRAAIGEGENIGGPQFAFAQTVGDATITLTPSKLPAHTHRVIASTDGAAVNVADPEGKVPATVTSGAPPTRPTYTSNGGNQRGFSPLMLQHAGAGQPFNNHSPYLVLNYCIAYDGIYPMRN